MSTPLTQTESDFIENFGLMAQDDGQSRILGRIWGLLLLRAGPIDAEEISEFLQISRASVSTNIKTLLNLRLLKRVSLAGERRDFFALEDDPYLSLMEGQIAKLERQIAFITKSRATFAAPHAKSSLKDIESFYTLLHRGFSDGVDRYVTKVK